MDKINSAKDTKDAKDPKELIKEAETILHSYYYWVQFWKTSKTQYQSVINLYREAGRIYKTRKEYNLAKECLLKSAYCNMTIKDKDGIASDYLELARISKYISSQDAAKYYSICINQYAKINKFNLCAKYSLELAELHETINMIKAINSYKQAVEFMAKYNDEPTIISCRLKVGNLLATNKNYAEAINIYEELAIDCRKSDVARYLVDELIFKAGLCRLCRGGALDMESGYGKYIVLNPDFRSTSESLYLTQLAEAVREKSSEKFNKIVEEGLTKEINSWETDILLKLRDKFETL